jgi:ABC-type glycerol-3-phosphate transport system substrate-binding protein
MSDPRRRATRRSALTLGAAATALPLVHIRSAGAAGRLSFAIWDHWVSTGDIAMKKLVDAWAEKNKVDVRLDFLSANINITKAAEAQAKTGHDIYAFDQWTVQQYADSLDPVDDVIQRLIAKYGELGHVYEYLGVVDKHWMAVPVGWGSAPLPPCGRISLLRQFCGVDVQAWYPAHESTPDDAKDWTYETQLKMAEAMFKAGYPIGFGCSQNSTDANQTWGAMFGAFGADLVNAMGEITIDSDNVMAVMEYCQQLMKFMPSDAVQWDDASNNRALISSKAALIWNPPSAWAVAKRDAPQVAADCWTFPNPKGPMGRLVPHRPYFWGIWKFARNKSAAKELIEYLSQREQVEQLAVAASGYDIPPFQSMTDLSVWSDVEPPKGTIYNYPARPWHDSEYYVPGSSAPPEIAVQIWNRYLVPGMVGRLLTGQSIKQALAWGKEELEGFVR